MRCPLGRTFPSFSSRACCLSSVERSTPVRSCQSLGKANRTWQFLERWISQELNCAIWRCSQSNLAASCKILLRGKKKSKPVYITRLSSDRVRELSQEGLQLALWLMVFITKEWTEESLFKAMKDTLLSDGFGRPRAIVSYTVLSCAAHQSAVRPSIMIDCLARTLRLSHHGNS